MTRSPVGFLTVFSCPNSRLAVSRLFIQKQFALHDLMDECAKTIPFFAAPRQYLRYLWAVRKLDTGARSVDGKLLDQVAGELLLLLEEELFKLAHILELSATRQFATRIHFRAAAEMVVD